MLVGQTGVVVVDAVDVCGAGVMVACGGKVSQSQHTVYSVHSEDSKATDRVLTVVV